MADLLFTIASLAVLSTSLQAQTPAPIVRTDPTTPPPTFSTPSGSVADVIALTHNKVSDDVILAKLAQANQPQTLSVDDILQLKQAGVSDAVVRAMIAPVPTTHVVLTNQTFEQYHSMNPTGATPPFPALGTSPDNPAAPHESGIYLAAQNGPTEGLRLEYMDRAAITGTEENAGSMFSFFTVPLTIKYVVQPPRATLRTVSTTPVFYFYFDNKPAGLGETRNAASAVTNPSQFQLLRFSASKKKRTMNSLKFGIFIGVSNGEKPLPFTTERLGNGVYRITVSQPLKPGEYAFVLTPPELAASPGEANDPNGPKPDLYDFGVDPS